ncbi:MAG: hypothetical protein ABJA34_12105 [Pseudonocardiales bacterium]
MGEKSKPKASEKKVGKTLKEKRAAKKSKAENKNPLGAPRDH